MEGSSALSKRKRNLKNQGHADWPCCPSEGSRHNEKVERGLAKEVIWPGISALTRFCFDVLPVIQCMDPERDSRTYFTCIRLVGGLNSWVNFPIEMAKGDRKADVE